VTEGVVLAIADNAAGGLIHGDRAADEGVQGTITRIWEQVLRLDDLTPQDNFFGLGGHSLAASQVNSRIHDALGIEVSLAVFFERPTIAELATYVLAVMSGSGA
jgi:acyl carrier protein